MISNFQTWLNSGHFDCFSCILTTPDGQEWHVYGARAPYGIKFEVQLTLREQESNPMPILLAKGQNHVECLMNALSIIQSWHILKGVN